MNFHVNITTPERNVYSGDIEHLRVNTPDGKIGMLYGALPRVCIITEGDVEINTTVLQLHAECGDGIMIAEGDRVTVLAEFCVFDGEPREEQTIERAGDPYKLAKAKIASALGRSDKSRDDN